MFSRLPTACAILLLVLGPIFARAQDADSELEKLLQSVDPEAVSDEELEKRLLDPKSSEADKTGNDLEKLLDSVDWENVTDSELEKLLEDPELAKAVDQVLEVTGPQAAPKWSPVFSFEAGLGFKKNVALSPVRPETSPLLRSLSEVIVVRDDSDGLEAFFYGSWEDFRYSDSEVDKEQTGLLMAEFKRKYESGWDIGWNGQYIYQNQVLDLSTELALPQTLRIEGNTLLTSAKARRYLPNRFWADGRFELGRQNFVAPLDDYWEYTPTLQLAKWWKQNHVGLSYQFTDRPHDNRAEPDLSGLDIVGTQLEFNVHRIELEWKQRWGSNESWRTRTRIRREISTDNGTGYFKYRRWRIDQRIRFVGDKWNFNAQGTWSPFKYPNQEARLGFSERRARTDWTLGFRIERAISRFWRGYVAYDWEKSNSNQISSSYSVSLFHAGLIFEN